MSHFPSRDDSNTSLAARVDAVAPLSDEERRALDALTTAPPVLFQPQQKLLETDTIPAAYVLVAGWAMWHEELPDGTRQIFDFVLPGDIVGFTAMAEDTEYRRRGVHAPVKSPISVTALTRGAAIPVGRAAVDRLFERHPALGVLLLALTTRERSARTRRRLTSAWRRGARARVADLFLELWQRQRAIGLAHEQGFDLPVSQTVLGELLGLTPVHISRTLTQLARAGLVSVTASPERRIVLHDPNSLYAIAGAMGQQ